MLTRSRPLKLQTLLPLVLLLRLLVLVCPGGAFDKRELCRFTVAMNGSAPGIASSVRPAREFGALARKEGVPGITAEIVRIEVGEAVHVHPGECIRAIGVTSRVEGIGSKDGIRCF